MNRTPSTSIIIPAYNRFSLLCEAINSVLAQSDKDYELIVVDDGSTDATSTVQAIYGRRLQYVRQENRGVSAARNRGISEARGNLIAFLDSDDLWCPEKLAVQKAAMKKDPSCQISYTEEIWFRKGVRVNPMKKHAKASGWIFEKLLRLCLISPSSVLVRKNLLETVGTFTEEFPVCEDYDLWLRISKDYPVHLIRQPLIIKRNGHAGQLSAAGWGFDRFRVESIVRLVKGACLTPAQTLAAQEVLKTKCRILSQGFYKRGNHELGHFYEFLPAAPKSFASFPPAKDLDNLP